MFSYITMLLNISSDRIIFKSAHEHIILPYWELEKEISTLLYQHIPTTTEKLIVINGPWSFTNLRIATLALNTYNMLHNFPINFVNVSKIERYQLLYSNSMMEWQHNRIIARYCIMYIGQKKNFWIVDLAKTKNDGMVEWHHDGVVKIHVDEMKEYVDSLGNNWFVDEMVAEGKETIDRLFGEWKYSMYQFIDTDRTTEWQNNETKMIDPNYMIDANID